VTARTPTVKWAGWIEATDTEYDDGYDDCNKYQCAYTTIAIMAPTVSVLATKSHDHDITVGYCRTVCTSLLPFH